MTGGDKTIALSHAPETYTAVQQEAWLSFMQAEHALVELISGIGMLLWPAVPILFYLIAWREAYYTLQGKEMKKSAPFAGIALVSSRWDAVSTRCGTMWRTATKAVDAKIGFIGVHAHRLANTGKTKFRDTVVDKRNSALKKLHMSYLSLIHI